ncbi:MAG: hypothetical protein EA374_02885 [Acholeplasmatales bacterium]|nr:MAG: hypothetical protein EA374_02885 [Acholeplasmatales bacterium]
MQRLNKGLGILTIVLMLYGILAVWPKPGFSGDNVFRSEDGLPLIIAHGGGNHEFPDNTIEAYINAYAADAHVIFETDVVMTQDGVIILSHDRTLDRKTDLPAGVSAHEITYDALVEQAVDFGYENPIDGPNGFKVSEELVRYTNYRGETVTPLDVPYPDGLTPRHPEKFLVSTLEELITLFPEQRIIVEIKQYGDLGAEALAVVIALLDQLDAAYNTYARISLASFHRDIYDNFVQLQNSTHPQLMFSPQYDGVLSFFILAMARLDVFYREPIGSLQLPLESSGINLVRSHLMRTAHAHNMAVHYWTINDEEDMRRLIALGADGILTDRPHKLAELLEAKRSAP